jgi:hypothetical protein
MTTLFFYKYAEFVHFHAHSFLFLSYYFFLVPIYLSTSFIYLLSLRFQKLFSQLPHHSIPFPIEGFSLCRAILVLPTSIMSMRVL